MDGTVTTRLLPDLDDELTAALAHVEELLLEVAAWEDDDPDTAWPPPLAGAQALAAVRRIWDAVAPAQGERAAKAGRTGRLLAPDGRYEHAPLRLVDVGQADIDALAAAAAVFGTPLTTSARPSSTALASPTTTKATRRAPGWSRPSPSWPGCWTWRRPGTPRSSPR
jgi:hypothetical protein